MAFYGSSFSFDGISCKDFDLMLYGLGNEQQDDVEFASSVSVVEEVVGQHWRPHFLGVKFDKKLTFKLVFGVDECRIERHECLSRQEIDDIASWLTGHQTYKYLEIEQEDLEHVRYKCMVSDLTLITHGQEPWAMSATITCDGAYAYTYPKTFSYTINGNRDISFYNESSYNGYYRPIVRIESNTGSAFSIANISDGGRVTELIDIPEGLSEIIIDMDRGTITSNSNVNLYEHFNFRFLKLKRGYNKLRVTGNCVLKIQCEFPVNTGG